jgi:Leucine-rich repeat (LRR) protein
MSGVSQTDAPEWEMLDEEQWSDWESSNLLVGKERVLRWGETPAAGVGGVRSLRLLAKAADTLPEGLAGFSDLESLQFGSKLVKQLTPESLPPSVTALQILGAGSATWPRALVLPGVTQLDSASFTLRFRREQLPALTHLGIKLGKDQARLDLVRSYPELKRLSLTAVNVPAFFDAIAGMPLELLAISGGAIDSVAQVAALPRLERLVLNSLPRLTRLTGLSEAKSLRDLHIAYCTHLDDLSEIPAMPSLRSLHVIGCKEIGLTALRPALEAMALDVLDTSATS